MRSIKVLPGHLASQIAAGEVVERPASALKELLENALDAEATRCTVEIEGGGIGLISVLDNGVGMGPDDAAVCLERHATSKLREMTDLERLATYGFRGEGLPSIAAVSRLRLRSRRADQEAGLQLELEGGLHRSTGPAGCAIGTLVEVRDLFFNVPARRKFLRSTGTESAHLVDVVDNAALAQPLVSLTLHRDGRRVRQWLKASTRAARVAQWAGDERLLTCQGEKGPLRVEAFLAPPHKARAGAAGLKIFVNARPIRDRALAVAVAQSYGSLLERGRYPRGVVYLELPAQLVDFNVHPQKTELRFSDPRAACSALHSLLRQSLARELSELPGDKGAYPLSDVRELRHPPVAGAPGAPLPHARSSSPEPPRLAAPPPRVPAPAQAPPPTRTRSPSSESAPVQRALPELGLAPGAEGGAEETTPGPRWVGLRFLSQVRKMFLVCESPDGLVVLDQHAAAERVTYARLKREWEQAALQGQSLLFPTRVELVGDDLETLRESLPQIERLGFSLREEEGAAVLLAIPRIASRADPETVLRGLIAELAQRGREFSERLDRTLATLACHGSVRAGDTVSAAEAQALLEGLESSDFAAHCPHGRPVVAFTPFRELERKLGRR